VHGIPPSLNAFRGMLDKYWDNYQFSLYPGIFLQRRFMNIQSKRSSWPKKMIDDDDDE